MSFNLKMSMLLLTTLLVTLQNVSALIYSNSTALMHVPDEQFYGMPVYFKSNYPAKHFYSALQMKAHIHEILAPLTPYILSSDTRVAQRRQDYGQINGVPTIIELHELKLPFIAAAQIGDYTFSCRQNNGDLVIFNPMLPIQQQLRSIPSFTEFQIHPRPGIWWWVQCVTFETGGAGMGITGVQKPGGDQGIDPNALKSLVG